MADIRRITTRRTRAMAESSQPYSVIGSNRNVRSTRSATPHKAVERDVKKEELVMKDNKTASRRNSQILGHPGNPMNEFTHIISSAPCTESIQKLVLAENSGQDCRTEKVIDFLEAEKVHGVNSHLLDEFNSYNNQMHRTTVLEQPGGTETAGSQMDDFEVQYRTTEQNGGPKLLEMTPLETASKSCKEEEHDVDSNVTDPEGTLLHDTQGDGLEGNGCKAGAAIVLHAEPTPPVFATKSPAGTTPPAVSQSNPADQQNLDPATVPQAVNVQQKKTRKPRAPKTYINGPVTPETRKEIAKQYRTAMTNSRERLNLGGRKGQHTFNNADVVAPTFTPELILVIQSGDRKAIAKEFDNIVKQTVHEIAPKEGSGSKPYYRILESKFLVWYPEINNPLFRNICRRRLKKSKDGPITIEELSEDELEKDVLLHPQPGRERRSVTKGRSLGVFSKVLSNGCRERRKQLKAKRVLEHAANPTSVQRAMKVIFTSRFTRSSMEGAVDEEAKKSHADIRAAKCKEQRPETNLLEAYRNTFIFRSNAVRCGTTSLETKLEFYPMLTNKTFIDVEAELYLGSLKKLKNYHSNVKRTWHAISQLDDKQTAEENFKKYMLAFGDDVVEFVADAPLDWDTKSKFPNILKISGTGQVILRYKSYNWLELTGIDEALGYLILLVAAFDFPLEGRSYLLLMLESMFFGYVAPGLKGTGTMFLERLQDLCPSYDDSSSNSDDEDSSSIPEENE